jgi:hypothetical protein
MSYEQLLLTSVLLGEMLLEQMLLASALLGQMSLEQMILRPVYFSDQHCFFRKIIAHIGKGTDKMTIDQLLLEKGSRRPFEQSKRRPLIKPRLFPRY